MTTVQLSTLRAEIQELAETPDPLSDAAEHRWRQLVPHWLALTSRILEDKN
jgi:hypothetical protein